MLIVASDSRSVRELRAAALVGTSESMLEAHKRNHYPGMREIRGTLLRLDGLDHKILALLAEDGRASYASLGKAVGLSTAATKRRVDRLRNQGAIRRFAAEISPAALGWTIEAFVELYCEGRVPPDQMRQLVATIPEVADAYTVTGEADGILLVRAEDASHFERVLGVIRNHPGVSRTRSAIVLSHL
jgi:DNA-binding Lrp family transcriptional regulator